MTIDQVAASGFTPGAEGYDRGRSSYAPAVVSFLVNELGVGPGRRVLDLAIGTGKLTALVVGTAADVVAVEPLDAMRPFREAQVPEAEALAGTVEAIPLEDASVDVVTVAQAFHWFRPFALQLPEQQAVLAGRHPSGRRRLPGSVPPAVPLSAPRGGTSMTAR